MFSPTENKRRLVALPQIIFAICNLTSLSIEAQELRLDTRATFRYDDDQEGSDFDSNLFTGITLTDLIKDRVDLKISGWGLWDIDGNDPYDTALDGKDIRISEAYIDLRNVGALTRARIGRQRLRNVDYLHLDGTSLFLLEDKPLSVFLFAGREVTYYESAMDDWTAGGGVVWKPSWKTRHQMDSYLLQESGNRHFASAWRWTQYWGGRWRTTSRLRFVDSQVRDWRVTLSKYFESIGLGTQLDYYHQPKRRGEGEENQSRTLAAFGRILGPRVAQHRIGLNLTKYMGESWLIQVGGSVRRRLSDDEDRDFNSVESESGHISITRMNLLIDNLDLTISGESFNNEHDSLDTFGGHLNYRLNRRWEFGLGLSYSRFRFDPIDFDTTLNGRPDLDILLTDLKIPTYFAEGRWRPNRTFDIRADVSFQPTDDIAGNGMSARLGINYHLRKSLEPQDEMEETP